MEVIEKPSSQSISYTIIIPDNWKEYVPEELLKGLTKSWYTYASANWSNHIYLKSDWEWQKQQEQERIKAQEEKERKEKEQDKLDEELIEGLRAENPNWITKDWIDKNVGRYVPWHPCYEYYWNIIKDNFRVVDWKKNISIDKKCYDKIEGIKGFRVDGKWFLQKSFKNPKGYSAYIIDTYTIYSKATSYGVYCIQHKQTEEIVYVGSTFRDFEVRWQEHNDNLAKGSHELAVYDLLREEGIGNFYFSILLDAGEEGLANRQLERSDIESAELMAIKLLKPRGNIAGVKCEFKYR